MRSLEIGMHTDKLIAIQVGAASFVDEGVNGVLDTVQDRGGVNTLFIATPTASRGTGGRQIPGHPLPDHGVQEYDYDWVGGNYATVHPEYYGNTVIGAAGRAPDHPDLDLLADVIPAAQSRGIQSYAWIEEAGYSGVLHAYPNFPKVLEVDVWGRPTGRPCFNNPDYRNWHLGITEDYAKSYDLDGLAWCSERPGPLNLAMQRPVTAKDISCFCRHCQVIARDQGINVESAKAGFQKILDWSAGITAGAKDFDGAFTSFWRILLRHPEVLAWQNLWTESQRQLYRDIYGVAKASKPTIQVGWHVQHDISFSPFYRADQDFAELSKCSDFIKVVSYNNCGGPRLHSWIASIGKALFADATPTEIYPLMLKLLNLEEGDYDTLPQRGLSADYVRKEAARARASARGECKIYSGIDIDIANEFTEPDPRDFSRRAEALVRTFKTQAEVDALNLATSTREQVRDAVNAAFDGGADGVVLSRKYSEMMLDNLVGAGDAVNGR